MKNTNFKTAAICICTFWLFAFTLVKPGYITGRVIPAEALKDVWAVSAKDTVRALVIQGNFTIVNVKTGTYKVIVNAVEPYKDLIKEGITVIDGQPVDLGEIRLEK